MRRWIGVAISAASLSVPQAAMAAPPVGPREAVESAIVRVLTLMRDGEVNGTTVADRRAEIQRIARETFDFHEMARRALARHWEARTPDEQAEFVTLFRRLLERAYMGQIGASAGETITFVGESVNGGVAAVRAKVVTRRGTAVALDFRMHVRDGRWQVYDVLIGGASVVATYRSQFDRVIRAASYRALRDRLQTKSFDTALAERRAEGP
jgi:phospholipid transport system substrate-binding protein